MSEELQVQRTDDCEEMAATWQCLEIARLNDVLKASGLANKQLRQEICTRYFLDSGHFLDAGWFECEGRRVYPEICSAERQTPDANENLGRIHTLHLPSDAFAFHEYAHGDIGWYFEEHGEDASSIATGSL